VEYDASGKLLASSSADKSILLWNAYGDNDNYGIITGHKGAVLDIKWSRDARQIYSASSDLTLGTWDVASGTRIRKHVGHEDMVNSIDVVTRGTELIVSGSDDGSVGVWDPREKECACYFQTDYPVLAVAVDSVGSQIFSAGVEGTIKVWDPRNADKPLLALAGHGDSLVTGLRKSPDDQTLASIGTDNTVRTWDVRAFGPENRALKVYDGSVSGLEQNLLRLSWSSDGTKLAAGSSDRTAVIWEVHSRKILYKLPGHLGSVNDVAFSPVEPILASASSDRSLILGEIR
jgi:Prp8 binding protein